MAIHGAVALFNFVNRMLGVNVFAGIC